MENEAEMEIPEKLGIAIAKFYKQGHTQRGLIKALREYDTLCMIKSIHYMQTHEMTEGEREIYRTWGKRV